MSPLKYRLSGCYFLAIYIEFKALTHALVTFRQDLPADHSFMFPLLCSFFSVPSCFCSYPSYSLFLLFVSSDVMVSRFTYTGSLTDLE